MIANRPVRILEVVHDMNRGGLETWLMHVLRHIDRERFRLDFLVHTRTPAAYDKEIEELGSQILRCERPRHPFRFAKGFRQCLREHGPYDVVHSHVHHYSGFILRLAAKEGVPVRIAHSHTDTSMAEAQKGLLRKAYVGLMYRWLKRYATVRLACSISAGEQLFGPEKAGEKGWRVLHCGIDIEPFTGPVDRVAVRRELGLPRDAYVIAHIGRFAEVKNHRFLIDIMAELLKREPAAFLLLVGDGEMRLKIEQKVRELRIGERVIFTGTRRDVPRLLREAADVFVLPSLHEGLPLAGIEAQAAGLPCIFAETITREVAIVPGLTHWLSLTQSAADWAECLMRIRKHRRLSQETTLATIRESAFNITKTVAELQSIYSEHKRRSC